MIQLLEVVPPARRFALPIPAEPQSVVGARRCPWPGQLLDRRCSGRPVALPVRPTRHAAARRPRSPRQAEPPPGDAPTIDESFPHPPESSAQKSRSVLLEVLYMVDRCHPKHPHVSRDPRRDALKRHRRVVLKLFPTHPSPSLAGRRRSFAVRRASEVDHVNVVVGVLASEGTNRLHHDRRRGRQLRRVGIFESIRGWHDLHGDACLLQRLTPGRLQWILVRFNMAAGRQP